MINSYKFNLFIKKLGKFSWWWEEFRPKVLIFWGSLWIVFEPLTSTFIETFKFLKESQTALAYTWGGLAILTLPISLYLARPKSMISYQVKDREITVIVSIEDSFSTINQLNSDWGLVIPINNYFHVDLGNRVATSNSIQKQLILNWFGDNSSHLELEIKKQLNKTIYNDSIEYIDHNQQNVYKLGTTLRISHSNKIFYLIVNSKVINDDFAVETSPEYLTLALSEFWIYLSEFGYKDNILMPLIGTGKGRIDSSREVVAKMIVSSFLNSVSQKVYCENLRISIYPDDAMHSKINMNTLDDFVRTKCHYFLE